MVRLPHHSSLAVNPGLVSVVRSDGVTCVHVACARANSYLLSALLAQGADHNARHAPSGATPLILAVQEGAAACVEVLLSSAGPPPLALDSVTKKGQTAVFVAAKMGDVVLLKMLLERGADPERTETDATPLFVATRRGHTECGE
jgi:ankyrin repeat protein